MGVRLFGEEGLDGEFELGDGVFKGKILVKEVCFHEGRLKPNYKRGI